MRETFINDFLSIGLVDYFNDGPHSFERHVIAILVHIYGLNEIKRVYDKKNTTEFQNLLLKYGLKERIYENMLMNMVEYENFQTKYAHNNALRTNSISAILTDIIYMYIYKYLLFYPLEEDKRVFEELILTGAEIVKFQELYSENPTLVQNRWKQKRKLISTNVHLKELKPRLLKREDYRRYGLNINDVKRMDDKMVAKLNSHIVEYIEDEEKRRNNMTKKEKIVELGTTAISSGNGFVDALMILSIMATEISLGLIYIFLHGGK